MNQNTANPGPPKRWYAFAYLASDGFSMLGNSVIGVVLPVLIIMRLGSPVWAGTVAITTTAAQALAGFTGGAIADRVNRRNLSLFADLLSTASVLALFIVDWTGIYSVFWFMALGVIGAFADMPGQSARQSLGPQVAEASNIAYESITGYFQLFQGLGLVLGPALAGVFLLLPNPAWALPLTAAFSLLAALTTWLIPAWVGHFEPDPDAGSILQQSRAAIRLITNTALLRFLMSYAVIVNITFAVSETFVLPAHYTVIGEQDKFAWVLTTLGIGMMYGGVLYALIHKRFTPRPIFLTAVAANLAGALLLLSLWNLWIVLAGAFLLGGTYAVINATVMVRVMAVLPETSRGSVMGIMATLLLTVYPLGFAIATAFYSMAGLVSVQIIVALSFLSISLWVILSKQNKALNQDPTPPPQTSFQVSEGVSGAEGASKSDPTETEDSSRFARL